MNQTKVERENGTKGREKEVSHLPHTNVLQRNTAHISIRLTRKVGRVLHRLGRHDDGTSLPCQCQRTLSSNSSAPPWTEIVGERESERAGMKKVKCFRKTKRWGIFKEREEWQESKK